MKDQMSERAKPNGPGRPRSEEAERAILDATMELLAIEGYAGFTLTKVAARAHVSKATIYRRWPSKEHLVIAAMDRTPPIEPVDKGDVAEELIHSVLQFINTVRTTPLSATLPNLIAASSRNPELAKVFDPWQVQRQEGLKAIISRAIARGELPEALDLDTAVDMVMGPVVLRLFFHPNSSLSRIAVRDLVNRSIAGMRS